MKACDLDFIAGPPLSPQRTKTPMSTTPAQQRAADSSISAFGTSLVFNGSVVIVCYLAFGLLRTWRKNVYSPRTKRSSEIPKGIFAWIKPVIGVPDDVLLEKVGIDHYLFIRFFRMCFFLFSAFAVVALLLLVPLNAVAEDNSPGLKLITFGNVLDTNRLWAHSLLTIIFSVTVLYALRREFIVFIRLRQDYQQHHATAPHSRIVLVRDVPPHLNNPRLLRKLFSIFPGGVERVYVSRDPGDLPRLVNLRNRTLQRLETVEAQYVRSYDDVGRAKGGRLRETVAKVTGRGQFHTHQNHAPPKALIRLHELAEMSNFDLTAEEAAKGMTEEKKPVEMETEEKASEANEERVEVVQVGSRFMRESGATSKKFGTVGSWAGTFFKAPDAVAEPAEELGHSSSQYSSLPPPVPPKDLSLPVPAAAPSTIRRTRSGTIRTFTTSPFNTIRSFTRSLAPTNTTNNPAAAATQQAPHTHPPISLAHLPPRPTTLPHGRIPYVPAGAPVDAIKYHRARFLEINRMIKERQARARVVEDEEDKEGEGEGEGEARGVDKKEYKKIGVAFILFKTQMGAQTARQSVIYHGNAARMGERYVEVVPTDVIWANLRIGWQSRVVRKYIGLVASIVLVVFWGLIVAFITSIATLSNLLKILPFLQHAVELSPVITGIIEGLIPAAMLSGLMMLLPLILICELRRLWMG
ncbi:hypothetical protein BC937DRAFT_92716 [Endogone sp. FLAS-F59071]|nr:hypothetical protein BC937DRAFT_92716 [Endogone sp. FLAS-F59071]|eukprot:RUS15238.1 hypothetical protein BC937DRAFT_92716 [Endogone sp. FLAS-F59071]